MLSARTPRMPNEMVSPALGPTWNCWAAYEPSRMVRLLKVVEVAMRSSSLSSWPTSACSEARSEAELVALAACTASSRTRCRMLVDSCMAPSAVWARLMPSLALRAAWLRPRICEVIRSEMARPAASSLAELVALAACTASSRTRCRMLVDSCMAPSAVWARLMPSLALRAAWLRPRICEVIRSEMARPAASSLAELMRRPELSRCIEVARSPCDLARFLWAFRDATFVLIVKAMVSSMKCSPRPSIGWSGCQRCKRRSSQGTLFSVSRLLFRRVYGRT